MLNLVAFGFHVIRSLSLLRTLPNMAPAYLLGSDQLKSELLGKLDTHHVLRLPKMSIRFLQEGDDVPAPTGTEAPTLPVLVDAPPLCFSPEEYFSHLRTRRLGRLVLFAEKLTSCMDVTSPDLPEGLAVVALEQSAGAGRGVNRWESPRGCAMFSVRVHLSPESYLGRHVTLLQHLAGLAVVTALPPGYGEALGLKLKWPNDVLAAGGQLKVGGVLVTSSSVGGKLACVVGGGVNLDNDSPTTCLNALAEEHHLERLSLERFLALVLTRLEALLDQAQEDVEGVVRLYYRHWLHGCAAVTVTDSEGRSRRATVLGIDEYGFLLVRGEDGVSFSVQSTDNSFDVSRGQITPKKKP